LGYRAREHNERFNTQRSALVNRLTFEFSQQFCEPSGQIDWVKLVEFNSKNFDLDRFL